MVYIPKSQVKENQFTPGVEWFYVKDDTSYAGFYYTLSNGKAYTGKNPNNPPNEEIYQKDLIEAPDIEGVEPDTVEYNQFWGAGQDLKIYGKLKKTDYNLVKTIPPTIHTFPTSEDYENYYYTRYFVVKVNQDIFKETSLEVYNEIKSKNPVWTWEHYLPFTLTWTIKGNIEQVFKANNGMIFLKEKEIKRKGLNKYLKENYLEYYLYPEASNLYTEGGLLLTMNGDDYEGFYHVHKSQGPMVGPFHTETGHMKLFYKKFYKGEIVDSLNQTNVIETGETQDLEYRPTRSSTGGGSRSSTGGGY